MPIHGSLTSSLPPPQRLKKEILRFPTSSAAKNGHATLLWPIDLRGGSTNKGTDIAGDTVLFLLFGAVAIAF